MIEAPSAGGVEMFVSDEPDQVVYRVLGRRRPDHHGYADGPIPPTRRTAPLHSTGRSRAGRLRAVALAQPMISTAGTRNRLVVVGSTLRNHDRLVSGTVAQALRDRVLLVAAACVLAVYGLTRGLAS